MCLFSRKFLPMRAKEDIKCYKKLLIEGYDIITPYTRCSVGTAEWRYNSIDRVYEIENLELDSHVLKPKFSFIPYVFSISRNKYDSVLYEISKGFIHSYSSTRCISTKSWKGIKSKAGNYTHFIALECTIPKGTLYYEGCKGDYASRKLVINRIL